MLATLEKIIQSTKEGKISEIPYEKHVVFLVSGGLDSTIGVAQVIQKYGCIVHPLFVCRHSKNMIYEKSAVKSIFNKMLKIYPQNLRNLEIVDTEIPPLKFKHGLKSQRLSTVGHALRNVNLLCVAAQYAVFLNDNFDFNINTIFLGSIEDDQFPHNKLEAFRLMTLMLCFDLNDFRWQVISPFIDPWFSEIPPTKKENIEWTKNIPNLPIDETRTCTLSTNKPCGVCSDCIKRKEAFENAGLSDPAYK